MTNGDNKASFVQDLKELEREYGSVMGIVTESYDEIDKALKMKVPLALVTEKLNERFGLEAKPKHVSQCLYRIRKARKETGTSRSSKQTTTAKKITAQPHRVASPERSAEPEAPGADWTDLEKLVGYRLSDEIRDYVSADLSGDVKRVKENFPKGHRRSSEARGELTVLRRDLKRI